MNRGLLTVSGLFLGLMGLIVAAGCGCLGTGSTLQRAEFFNFKFHVATLDPATGRYRISWPAADGSCSGLQVVPEGQLAQWLQNNNSSLRQCAANYVVDVKDNRSLGLVDVEIHGDPATSLSDLQIIANRAVVPGTFNEPTGTFLQGTGPIAAGPLPGFAEFYFGTTGPIFTSDRGSVTLFDLRLDTVDLPGKRAGGSFQMLAANTGNPGDSRLLVVMDGSFLMDID